MGVCIYSSIDTWVYVYIAVLVHGCGVCIYSSIDTWVYAYIAVLIHGCMYI